MGIPDFESSTDVLLGIVSDNDFRDIEFCKKLINRTIREKRIDLVRELINKISPIFMFSSQDYRKEVIDTWYSAFETWTFEELFEACKESVLGNILVIVYLLNRANIITNRKLELVASLLELRNIQDPIVFEYLPIEGMLILDLNESLKSLAKKQTIGKAAEVCELFFNNGRLEKSKETIQSLLALYENSLESEQKFKGRIVSALLNKRMDLFIALMKKISNEIDNEDSLKENIVRVYGLLVNAKIPVYFEVNSFKFQIDRFYNDNFFFALLQDRMGTTHLLMPFEEVAKTEVQKLLDIENNILVTPLGRIGKISLADIYSFRKFRSIIAVSHEQTEISTKLSENEIGEKIRDILQDKNITSHSPAELADIYIHKLFLNNESDLRDCAIIIKGKGYPKITLADVASNILKAVDLPVQLVILLHTGILARYP